MERLPTLTEKMHRLRLAKWAGVTPDWFDSAHPEWEDAAAIGMKLEANLARGPEVTEWGGANHGKPLILH